MRLTGAVARVFKISVPGGESEVDGLLKLL